MSRRKIPKIGVPSGARPKCVSCDKELVPYFARQYSGFATSADQIHDVDHFAGWGWFGEGLFCKMRCAAAYGTRLAAKVGAA